MLLRGQHWTRYSYSVPVALGEHVLRLIPQGPSLHLSTHELQVQPQPIWRAEESDLSGNRVVRIRFSGESSELYVSSRFRVETSAPELPRHVVSAPLPWAASETNLSEAVLCFAQDLARGAKNNPLEFLLALTQRLAERTDRKVRLDGYAQSPEETLVTAKGACRDLTELFLACVRSQGMAGRFVSGYQATAQTPDGQFYLHAWPEVWLPDEGWFGFDPTHGIQVGEGHVPVCAAPSQAGTMPVEGAYTFQGPLLQSILSFGLEIQRGG